MITNINDDMNYNGIVSISYKIKDKIVHKTVHNQGTMQLKRAFAMFMCGGQTSLDARRYIPTRLDLRKNNTISLLSKPVLITGASYSKEPVEESSIIESSWFVEYISSIPYSSIISSISPQEGDTYQLYLMCNESYDGDINRDIASINISVDDILNLEPGVSMLIAWRLRLLNGND